MRPFVRISLAVTCVVLIFTVVACNAAPTPAAVPPAPTAAPVSQPTTAPAPQPTAAAAAQPTTAAAVQPTEAAAPQPTAASATKATSGGKLVFGMSYEPTQLDPHVGSSYEGATIDRAVCDTLVREATDGTFHPGLASKWEVSQDGLTYTFYLRKDVKFTDGTAFNAEAVKFNLDRIVDPATKSEQAISLVGPYASTEVVDDYTAKVHLKEAFGPFLGGIAQPNVSIVSPAAVKQYGDTFGDHLVGSGPFILKEHVRADHVTLVRNPDYNWGSDMFDHQGAAYLDEIEFKFITESTVRGGTLDTGETNMINDVPPEDFVRLAADSKYKTYNIIQPGTPLAIALNVSKAPLDDLKVRQALEYGIDKKAIVDTLFAGQYALAYSPLAPNTLGYWSGSEQMYPYDQAKAKSLLDEAGWKDTNGDGIREKNGQPLKLVWPTFGWQSMDKMAQVVQAQLKELGIDLTVNVGAFPAMYSAANKCEHNLVHTGNTDVDPNALDIVYNSANVGNGWAWTCTKDTEIDQLLKQGRALTDPAARIPIYTKLQQRILDQALVVPIRQFVNLIATRAEVKGLRFELVGFAPEMYDVHIEK
jgi:peptide/nickel transport system substrate-binding protein